MKNHNFGVLIMYFLTHLKIHKIFANKTLTLSHIPPMVHIYIFGKHCPGQYFFNF